MKEVYFKGLRRRETNSPLESTMFDPETKSLSTCQTLNDALTSRVLKANTRHPILPDRLSVSLPTIGFPGVYRPEGILFVTAQKPSYCSPFDLMALTDGNKFNHEDYGSNFLEGYQDFIFPDFDSMSMPFPNSNQAIIALNNFRESQGLFPLKQKINYNEICFEENIKFKPVALVGISPEIKKLSLDHRLNRYESVDAYLLHINHPIRHPVKNFRELVYLGLGSMFDGYQSLAQERG
jgi:hypothetical protein